MSYLDGGSARPLSLSAFSSSTLRPWEAVVILSPCEPHMRPTTRSRLRKSRVLRVPLICPPEPCVHHIITMKGRHGRPSRHVTRQARGADGIATSDNVDTYQ